MNAFPVSAQPKLRKRLVIVIAGVGVLFALLIGFNTFKSIMIGKFMASMGNPTQTISSMTAEYQVWQPEVEAFGNVRAVHGADLAFDVAGLIDAVAVKSGSHVKRGEVLVSLVAAEDRARLAALEASAELARLTAERSRQQLAAQAISKAQFDADIANQKAAVANAAAQAALVAKKVLRAPFAGRIGIITVSPGQYVSAGAAIVTLQQLDPVYIDFTVPQASLAQLQRGAKVTVSSDAFAGTRFAGKVSATDPKVNLSTRNVGVEATIANPKEQLVPGMFTRVAVAAGSEQRYLTLPQTAVSYAPYGDTVFVVRAGTPPAPGSEGEATPTQPAATDAKAAQAHYVVQTVVRLGPTRGDQVAVVSGIKAGDVVVSSGQMKLRNGTPVVINNSVQPSFDANPHPVED